MSASLHPVEVHRRRHRTEKRNKLRARLAAAPASARAALEAKLQRTYPPGSGPQQPKVRAGDQAPVAMPAPKA
jgi:hypothetical protein